MSRMFSSAEEAKRYGAAMADVDFEKTIFTEDPDLRVMDASGFLADPSTPKGKEAQERSVEGQQGFRFTNGQGNEVGIVIAPFREGFCVWGVYKGRAVRF